MKTAFAILLARTCASVQIPHERRRDERELLRTGSYIALALPTLFNKAFVDLIARDLGVAVEVPTEIAFCVARSPSSIILIVGYTYVIVMTKALPRVLEEVLVAKHRNCVLTHHLVMTRALSSKARDVESPEVDERLMKA